MKKKLIAMLASIAMLLGLTIAMQTALAPAAQAITCGFVYDRDWVHSPTGGDMKIVARLYACDHGHGITYRNITFTWIGGSTYVRKLYDNGADTNIMKRCNGVWSRIMNRSAYYNGSTYYFSTDNRYCRYPSLLRIDLTADIRNWPDESVRF